MELIEWLIFFNVYRNPTRALMHMSLYTNLLDQEKLFFIVSTICMTLYQH